MHNMRPQAMARLGFAWERLQQVNPRLVYCSAQGYGQDGPLADRPAFDDIIQGGSGLVALEMATGGEARFVPTLIGDKTVGLTMVYAVMAALLQRVHTGRGQAVEVPMLETMSAFVMAEHMGGLTFEPPLGPPGYARMLAPDRRPHRTADGHVCILPYTDRHWRDFFRIAGRPDLAEDPRLADAETRSRHVAELYALVAQCVSDRPSAFWLAELEAADIPCGPVNPLADLPADAQLGRRRFLSAGRTSFGRIDPHGAAAGAVWRRRLRAQASGAAARRTFARNLARSWIRRARDRRSPRPPDRDRGCPGLVGPGDESELECARPARFVRRCSRQAAAR